MDKIAEAKKEIRLKEWAHMYAGYQMSGIYKSERNAE